MERHVDVYYLLWFDMTEEGDFLSNGLVNGVSTPTHNLKHAHYVCIDFFFYRSQLVVHNFTSNRLDKTQTSSTKNVPLLNQEFH